MTMALGPQSSSSQAKQIWQAGVAAVDPARLIQDHVRLTGDALKICRQSIDTTSISEIFVVGAGKASAKMASGIEQALENISSDIKLSGKVIIPGGCELPTNKIELIRGRSTNKNLPTEIVTQTTKEILEKVETLDPKSSLCIALISGGGSALLCLPKKSVTLQDKIVTTSFLAQNGATIKEINSVRAAISQVKGGGLAQRCRSEKFFSFILSDVMEYSPQFVASGPTYLPTENPIKRAMSVLEKYDANRQAIPASVFDLLDQSASQSTPKQCNSKIDKAVINQVIGDNQTAIEGCAEKAIEFGYVPAARTLRSGTQVSKVAEEIAEFICLRIKEDTPACMIFGGEPVLSLANKSTRGQGGRAQQLTIEILAELKQHLSDFDSSNFDSAKTFAVVCGGTDGEDGPTDSAGGWIDQTLLDEIDDEALVNHIKTNNAYPFLQKHDRLLKTGNSGTNVCDLYVVLVN